MKDSTHVLHSTWIFHKTLETFYYRFLVKNVLLEWKNRNIRKMENVFRFLGSPFQI